MTTVTATALRRSSGADGQRQDGGDGEQRRGAGHHAHLGQRAHRDM